MKEPLYHDPHRSPVRGCCILQASILVLHNKTYKLQNFSEECLINSLVRFQCMNDQKKIIVCMYLSIVHLPPPTLKFGLLTSAKTNRRLQQRMTLMSAGNSLCLRQKYIKQS